MISFASESSIKQTINKSKFICFGFMIKNVDEAKQHIKLITKEYPDASHICYAYIIGNNQEQFYYSDDGEPNGTAGVSIYNAMKKNNMSFSLVIIVRYFGGIKFGVSLLKQTFSQLALLLISSAKLVNVKQYTLYSIEGKYDEIRRIENQYKNHIVKKEFFDNIVIFYIYGEQNANIGKVIDNQYIVLKK